MPAQKLTAIGTRNLRAPGRYSDGNCLYLLIGPTGCKSWMMRMTVAGRQRDLGLGPYPDVSLLDAREAAADMRRRVRGMTDPKGKLPTPISRLIVPVVEETPTFRAAAERAHSEREGGWRNPKHRIQWIRTLEDYTFRDLGHVSVDQVSAGMIHNVIAPVWLEKPETARRVLQRIGTVLDWSCAKGFREIGSPTHAVLKGLPRHKKQVVRRAAMPHADVPAFMTSLRNARMRSGRLALEALILTASRSIEIRGACWKEVDLEQALWFVSASRMKMGTAHTVPLSPAALDVLKRAEALRMPCTDLIFPGRLPKEPLSDMTLLKVLRDAELPYTVHGFRSSFRDWVAEETDVAGEVAEAALAHAVSNAVEAAYKRTDFLAKRRALMDAWGAFCTGQQPVNAPKDTRTAIAEAEALLIRLRATLAAEG